MKLGFLISAVLLSFIFLAWKFSSPMPPSFPTSDSHVKTASNLEAEIAKSITTQLKRNPTIPNIMYIRIQKTGSTSLRSMLRQLAKEYRMFISDRRYLKVTEERWSQGQHGRLQIYTGHILFQPFMIREEFWMHRSKPLLITMLRRPFDQFFSQFRYRAERCIYQPFPNSLDRKVCRFGNDFEAFSEYFCTHEEGKKQIFCNQETQFTQGELEDPQLIVNQYDLILILERFKESLAILYAKFKIPMKFLFELKLNENSHAQTQITCSPEMKTKLETEYLIPDQDLYSNAVQRLEFQIASLTDEQKMLFDDHVSKQYLFETKCASPCKANHLDLLSPVACDKCIANVVSS